VVRVIVFSFWIRVARRSRRTCPRPDWSAAPTGPHPGRWLAGRRSGRQL